MNKILVLGCPCSGKSTLSTKIKELTNYPLYHMDILFWRENWTHVSEKELMIELEKIVKQDKWIIDGHYSKTLEYRFQKCDMVIILDIPLKTCLNSEKKRRGKKRNDLPSYLMESYDPEFIQYIKDFRKNNMPQLKELIKKYEDKKVYIFKSRKSALDFVEKNFVN